MKKINVNKLRKGDIILTTSTKFPSAVIRAATFSDISHAMLYVANSSVIDSTGEGVQARNIDKMRYEDSCAIHVYRPIVQLPEKTIDLVIGYVRSETGAPYTTSEAGMSAIWSLGRGGKNQFCSRLVARAYASVGLELSKNPAFTTPGGLQRSSKLREIEDAVIMLSADDLDAERALEDTTVGMREVTNKLTEALRNITRSIRTLSDVYPFLKENPQYDTQFAEAYVASGYLTYWQVEVNRHPWRYDVFALVKMYHGSANKEEILDECREALRHDEEGDFRHWKVNEKALSDMVDKMPLETFKLELALYRQLCMNHKRRIDSARLLLKVYGGVTD
ncbi:YiiX/YebB-like N1pC/P60 family cysteine hydrolase [Paraburkholderia tropica]|uniref:YiiX/YebB-like N1pC/P60 family cysteine hydrolase n=1 Tax=Paraburkholderia tropica TaxID=92647 RepID=UPI0007EC494C|nr:YiiX/YebB-like N1pC/P60 family cysteine hydrolase [Paraburkholderia tropica]OBR53110.1 hypothetical protein A6456_09100 [Paraburkholderia tropica]